MNHKEENIIISDFFLSDLPYGGGSEYNDQIIYDLLLEKGISIKRMKSREVTPKLLSNLNKKTKIIVSNFTQLSESSKNYIINNFQYMIYEHDHKYLRRRIPSLFYNFKAPSEEIVNYDFYKSAMVVLAQTNFHKKIIELNIDVDNVVNLSGNLWTDEDFEQFKKNLMIDKESKCSILESPLKNKGMNLAIKYCEQNSIPYELIADKNYNNFLKKMAKNEKLIFLPTIPETFSRICIEAKMMNCSVITNGMIGAKYENWYSLKGEQLIEHMKQTREKIVNLVINNLNQ